MIGIILPDASGFRPIASSAFAPIKPTPIPGPSPPTAAIIPPVIVIVVCICSSPPYSSMPCGDVKSAINAMVNNEKITACTVPTNIS